MDKLSQIWGAASTYWKTCAWDGEEEVLNISHHWILGETLQFTKSTWIENLSTK